MEGVLLLNQELLAHMVHALAASWGLNSNAWAMRWRRMVVRRSNSGSTHWAKAWAGGVQRSVAAVDCSARWGRAAPIWA